MLDGKVTGTTTFTWLLHKLAKEKLSEARWSTDSLRLLPKDYSSSKLISGVHYLSSNVFVHNIFFTQHVDKNNFEWYKWI